MTPRRTSSQETTLGGFSTPDAPEQLRERVLAAASTGMTRASGELQAESHPAALRVTRAILAAAAVLLVIAHVALTLERGPARSIIAGGSDSTAVLLGGAPEPALIADLGRLSGERPRSPLLGRIDSIETETR